jgi:hypothetical protein
VTEFRSIYLILSSALGPGVYSASNRNECHNKKRANKHHVYYSTTELYRPSGRHLSANLVTTVVGRGVSRGQRNGPPLPLISGFYLPETYINMLLGSRVRPVRDVDSSSVILTRLSGPRSRPATSQKNRVAPGIEPGAFGSVARKSDH